MSLNDDSKWLKLVIEDIQNNIRDLQGLKYEVASIQKDVKDIKVNQLSAQEEHKKMNTVLTKLQPDVAHHIRRSDALEDRMLLLEDEFKPLLEELKEERAASSYFIKKVVKWSKIIALVSSLLGVTASILKIMGYF